MDSAAGLCLLGFCRFGIERPAGYGKFFGFYRFQCCGHNGRDFSLAFQIGCIVGNFFFPINSGAVGIFVGKFFATFYLIEALVGQVIQNIGIEIPLVGRIVVNPVIEFTPFVIGELHVVVSLFQHSYQFARVGMIFIGLQYHHVAFAALAMYVRVQIQVGSAVTQAVFLTTTQIESFIAVVAGNTCTVENRLHFKVESE